MKRLKFLQHNVRKDDLDNLTLTRYTESQSGRENKRQKLVESHDRAHREGERYIKEDIFIAIIPV